MRLIAILLLCSTLVACGRQAVHNPEQRLEKAKKELAEATSEQARFYVLGRAAKDSFAVGARDDARKYAIELLELLPKFQGDWNYGNAIQDGNVVLGRIDVAEGRIVEAKVRLLAAGKSPGSPQMNSFGPNMSLADDLLQKGEREVVLSYFELCRSFWSLGTERLDQWSRDVKSGKPPDFGANLIY